MDGQALVELALKELRCSQKELALKLGVSSTQVSKWKTDPKEHMSTEMEKKLSEIARIGERYPRFIALAGSLKDAIKWEKLIKYQAEQADFASETPYETYLLDTEEDDGNVLRALCWHTFDALQQMGVVLPATFPKDLDPKDTLGDTTDIEKHFDARLDKALGKNPYATLIYAIFRSLTSVSGFNSAYIQELMDDDDLGVDREDFYGTEFEYCLVYLAAAKTEVDKKFAPNFRQFRHNWLKQYEEWVSTIKARAFRAGVPLRVELLDLVYDDNEDLDQACERESWGFNATRLHPDIYMNELLVGMRMVHQVLPAVLEKLGLDKTFKLDESALRLDRPITIQWGPEAETHKKDD